MSETISRPSTPDQPIVMRDPPAVRRMPWTMEPVEEAASDSDYEQLDDAQRLAAVSLNFDDFVRCSPKPDLLNNAFDDGTTVTDSASEEEEDIPAQQPLPVSIELTRNYMTVTAPVKVSLTDAVRGAQRYMESMAHDMDVADFNRFAATVPGFADAIAATHPPEGLFPNLNHLVLVDNCQFKWLHAHGIFPAHDFYNRWLTTQFILYGGM